MDRRNFLQRTALLAVAPLALTACASDHGRAAPSRHVSTDFEPLEKSDAEWRALLGRDEFYVLFQEGTERPFSSPLNDEYREGTYVCAACFLPLFLSEDKFDSGTGWPSFTRPIPGRMGHKLDHRFAMTRSEYHCARCGGHQGHVFEDGPPPTGERWCNNGVALRFVPAGAPLPPLRT
jgi:peptide-methionine (R)-S-oxide reductase